MNNIATDYAYFDIIDYKNESVLSSYNLSITPLTFKARIPKETDSTSVGLVPENASFDFGDGTIVNGATATHVYNTPGQYTVNMTIRDSSNNALLAGLSSVVTIYNYIVNTFSVSGTGTDPGTTGGGYAGKGHLSNLNLSAGEYSDPITVYNQTPENQSFQNIYYSVSGDKYKNYFNLEKNKFNHLKNYFSFYKQNFLPNLSADEYVEIGKIALSSSPMYVRLSSFGTDLSARKIISSNRDHESAISVGSSGKEIIYFKTEEQKNPIFLSFFKDQENIFSKHIDTFENTNYSTNLNIVVSSFVGSTSGQALSNIAITSNGLGGEGDEVNSFPVSPIQYKGVSIPFTLSPKNSNNYTGKALSASGSPSFRVLSGKDTLTHPLCIVAPHNYTVSTINTPTSTFGTDFCYRGLLTFNDGASASSTAITLCATNKYAFPTTPGVITMSTLTGATHLSCYPENFYNLDRHNEDFDFEQTIKDLRFQEVLLDKNTFFNDFIGSIFGGVSSSHDLLGKKLYESIFNFVPNNSDIDFCNINSLNNLSNMVDEEGLVFNRSNFLGPVQVKRAVDILSTNYNKFRGATNKFDENFNPRGDISRNTYGKNLSGEIDTATYVVTAGTPIVAEEKFSTTYTKLNTYQPLSSATLRDGRTDIYSLSELGTDNPMGSAWGWPLALPTTYDIGTVKSLYNFYEYNDVTDGTIEDGLIDFTNPLTTLSFNTPLSNIKGKDKIEDIMIRDALFSSLSLFPS